MKRAMTLIEIIMVIVIIGIISAVTAPNFERNSLREAAYQVLSHIRYTQHLAMIDNKYDPLDQFWYKKRWQLAFGKSSAGALNTDGEWAYTIFSDTSNDGNPNPNEIAKNILDNTKLLSGGYSNTLDWQDSRATREMNLGKKFGIVNVSFSGCGGQRIAFDNIGRPINGNISSMTTPYQSGRISNNRCDITLVDQAGNSLTIAIEPETGYTHIL